MADDDLMDFLTDRLTEDLASIWARGRPGMAAQVAASSGRSIWKEVQPASM